jgi:hypothetical protein
MLVKRWPTKVLAKRRRLNSMERSRSQKPLQLNTKK